MQKQYRCDGDDRRRHQRRTSTGAGRHRRCHGRLGTDIAMEARGRGGDERRPRRIAETVRLSQRTHAVLWQNIALALGIKAVFLALALFDNASMWMAVRRHGASPLVVFNGLRLLRTLRTKLRRPVDAQPRLVCSRPRCSISQTPAIEAVVQERGMATCRPLNASAPLRLHAQRDRLRLQRWRELPASAVMADGIGQCNPRPRC